MAQTEKETKVKGERIDLGRDGTVTVLVSENAKRLLIGFSVDSRGLSKAGVNGLIDALKKARDKMKR
jgi:mRNA degradation ribonuclease J1/J2